MNDVGFLISQMDSNSRRIQSLLEGVSTEQAQWKPDAETWSLLEVLNHLLDEEKRDFRVRLDITLHRPEEPWPPIDPGGWVTAHEYNQQDLTASLQEFLQERESSLDWLRGLTEPDWQAEYEAPFGPIAAGDLFASWVAHDLLHMRQLVELQWLYTTAQTNPYRTRYAGTW
jgi:hypothetical protein